MNRLDKANSLLDFATKNFENTQKSRNKALNHLRIAEANVKEAHQILQEVKKLKKEIEEDVTGP